MENKEVLLSTSILSYIWHERKLDNVDLIKPFVLNIISNKYSIGEELNCDFIIERMGNEHSFLDIPLVILQKVLNRLSNDRTKILKKTNNNYILVGNILKERQEFENRKNVASMEIERFIIDLKKWLILHGVVDESFSDENVNKAIIKFLEKNGYIIIKSISNVYNWSNSDTAINYNICKYIMEQYEGNTDNFKVFNKIIQGFMISNVMHLQFDTNSTQSFKGVDFYFDSPLLLSVLGLKTERENRVANELVALLLSQNAAIKCFEHNYNEVEGIIDHYKMRKFGRMFKKSDDSNTYLHEQTLEYFDDNNYDESDVELVLTGLRDNLASRHVKIVPCPNISDSMESNVNFAELTEYIKKNYTRDTKEKTIYADIESVNAIKILRKSKHFTTIEESKAVFVTLNYNLINIIDKYFDLTKYNDVSYCINDVHLTSLLWMKNNTKNSNISELKLISSILAGFEIPNNMIMRIRETLMKLEKYTPGNINSIMNKVLTTQTSHAIMEITGGDVNKIDEENILNAISEEKNIELKEKEEQINKYKKKLEENENEFSEKILRNSRALQEIISEDTRKRLLFVKIVINIFIAIILFCWLVAVINIISSQISSNESNLINKSIILASSFFGYIGIPIMVIKYMKKKKTLTKVISRFEYHISKKNIRKYENM